MHTEKKSCSLFEVMACWVVVSFYSNFFFLSTVVCCSREETFKQMYVFRMPKLQNHVLYLRAVFLV